MMGGNEDRLYSVPLESNYEQNNTITSMPKWSGMLVRVSGGHSLTRTKLGLDHSEMKSGDPTKITPRKLRPNLPFTEPP